MKKIRESHTMALYIENAEADRLARDLADRTGETLPGPSSRFFVSDSKEAGHCPKSMIAPMTYASSLIAFHGFACSTRSADDLLGHDERGAPNEARA